MPNTTDRPSSSASTAPLRSRLPVSTATTRCTGLAGPSNASAMRGSHAAPSWATITAVTTCWPCGLDDDTNPLAAQDGRPPGTAMTARSAPGRRGYAVNNTRTDAGQAGTLGASVQTPVSRAAAAAAAAPWLTCGQP